MSKIKVVTIHCLQEAVDQAEAGDSALWEDIARVLLAERERSKAKPSKPPRKKGFKKNGVMTWAHVTLKDGREYLTSAYERVTQEETLYAHIARAQRLAQNEDCGADLDCTKRFDPSTLIVEMHSAYLVQTPRNIDKLRDECFEARGRRQGWWEFYVASEAIRGLNFLTIYEVLKFSSTWENDERTSHSEWRKVHKNSSDWFEALPSNRRKRLWLDPWELAELNAEAA